MAWLYGPMGFGARSVKTALFTGWMGRGASIPQSTQPARSPAVKTSTRMNEFFSAATGILPDFSIFLWFKHYRILHKKYVIP
jgi:hypothetical protein